MQTEQLTQEILNRFDAIALKLGVASEYIWQFTIKQQAIEGFYSIAIWALITIASLATTVISFKKARNDGMSMSNWYLGFIIGSLCLLPCVFVGLSEVSTWITQILNPEYAAFKEIVSMMR